MKYVEKLGHLLPLGYLYLVVLGILKQSVFLYQLDVNILKYSSIMDVLISPIATLLSNPIIFTTIVSVFVFSYHLPALLYKHGHKKWVKKAFELKKSKDEVTDEEIKDYYLFISVKTMAVVLMSIFIGYGGAEGFLTARRLESGTLKYNHQIKYNTGESEHACIVENNSLYYFYFEKGQPVLKIAPVSSIRNIELVK